MIFLNNRLSRPYSELRREIGIKTDIVQIIYKDSAKRLLQNLVDVERALVALCVNQLISLSNFFNFAKQFGP